MYVAELKVYYESCLTLANDEHASLSEGIFLSGQVLLLSVPLRDQLRAYFWLVRHLLCHINKRVKAVTAANIYLPSVKPNKFGIGYPFGRRVFWSRSSSK